MIARIWHGWTTPENADDYYQTLTSEVIPGIEAMDIEGLRKINVLRKDRADEVEFITIMYFDSLKSIKNFAGEDYETAHVPKTAQLLLKKWDKQSQHYEVKKLS